MKTPIEQLENLIYSHCKMTGLGNEMILIDVKSFELCVSTAKRIEKQRICDAYFGGYLNGESKTEIKSDAYYNEQFDKSDKP